MNSITSGGVSGVLVFRGRFGRSSSDAGSPGSKRFAQRLKVAGVIANARHVLRMFPPCSIACRNHCRRSRADLLSPSAHASSRRRLMSFCMFDTFLSREVDMYFRKLFYHILQHCAPLFLVVCLLFDGWRGDKILAFPGQECALSILSLSELLCAMHVCWSRARRKKTRESCGVSECNRPFHLNGEDARNEHSLRVRMIT